MLLGSVEQENGFAPKPVPWDVNFPALVGFWDMVDFAARPFAVALGKLQLRKSVADCWNEQGRGQEHFSEKATRLTMESVEEIARQCEEVEIDAAQPFFEKLSKLQKKRGGFLTPEDVRGQIQPMIEVIQDQLNKRRFTYIPLAKASSLETFATDWDPIWKKFGSDKTRYHSREAVYCYALERNTACVFHCMCVLEPGLKSLARRLDIRNPKKDWGSIIGEIDKKIAMLRALIATKKVKPRARAVRANLLTFCSEAAKEFFYFKDAWRNHTAHGRAQYDENDARKILEHVRQFLTHLSTKLREIK